MNAKCLTQKRQHFIYSLSKGAVRGSDYIAPNVPQDQQIQPTFVLGPFGLRHFALTRLANLQNFLICAVSFSV